MVSRHHCAALTRCAAAVATALLSLQASAQAQSVTTAPEAPGLSTITVTGNWLDNPSEEKVLEHPGARSIVERKRIEETGSLIVADTPEHFFEEIKAEYAVYKDVVQKQNLTMD
jgi:Fe(3+) dicitrate transport protein